jgi:hypothetical protein
VVGSLEAVEVEVATVVGEEMDFNAETNAPVAVGSTAFFASSCFEVEAF